MQKTRLLWRYIWEQVNERNDRTSSHDRNFGPNVRIRKCTKSTIWQKKSTKKTTMVISEIYASSCYVFPNMWYPDSVESKNIQRAVRSQWWESKHNHSGCSSAAAASATTGSSWRRRILAAYRQAGGFSYCGVGLPVFDVARDDESLCWYTYCSNYFQPRRSWAFNIFQRNGFEVWFKFCLWDERSLAILGLRR